MSEAPNTIRQVVQARPGDITARAYDMKSRRARLITVTCLDKGDDELELRYHFEVEGGLEDVRLTVPRGGKVPSITPVYFSAVLIENELQDFFGVSFTNVVVDFQSRMLLHKESARTPMLKVRGASYCVEQRKIPRCVEACPCGVDIPRYLRLIAAGELLQAIEVIRERNPLPSVCGRVCFAPCESACRQALEKRPVAVRLLKRFAADRLAFRGLDMAKRPSTGKRVAVVGSGPAGLSAAYYLARAGHTVVVFEALPRAGGMLRVGIPDYRLPQAVLDAEIATITTLGVTIKTDCRVESLDRLLGDGYDAVFVAVGAHEDMALGIPGEDLGGVHSCVSLLRRVKLGQPVQLGSRVAVVGGGNSAIDTARTALRCGSQEVTILYRRTRKEMPASPEEVEAALEEGIKIEFLTAPLRVESRNGQLELTCQRMRLGEPDASGRARPVPIEGSEHSLLLDAVVSAIGQRPQVPASFNLELARGGTLVADSATLACQRPGVFAGGDAWRGPSSVVAAIADGRLAAISIDRYLGGDGVLPSSQAGGERVPRSGSGEATPRASVPTLEPAARVRGFAEVELGFSEEAAKREARRCWSCDWNE